IAVDRAGLVDGEIPRDPLQLIVHVHLQRVARGDVDRGEQRAHQERDQAERQHRAAAEDREKSFNHRDAAAGRLNSSGFKNVNRPFQTASGAMTSPSAALKVTPAGCTMPVDRPLMIECGGTSPSSPTSFHTPTKPSVPVFHGDGSSASGGSPSRGLSMLYGGRYSLLIAATKMRPVSGSRPIWRSRVMPVFGPAMTRCGATLPSSVRLKIRRPVMPPGRREYVETTSRSRTGSTEMPTICSSFVLSPWMVRAGASSPVAPPRKITTAAASGLGAMISSFVVSYAIPCVVRLRCVS